MGKLFADLRRRRVFRVAAVYAVVAWLLIQIVTAIETPLNLPDWFDTIVIVLLAIGFPLAILFAWVFDLTPDGIKITESESPAETPQAGGMLDYALIVSLLVVAGVTIWGQVSPAISPSLASMPQEKSIAVLPFDDTSPGGDQQYFGDGIADELLYELTNLDGLNVASRTSSFSFRNSQGDVRAIGAALNVNLILEGTVRKDGNQIRVTAQLVNSNDGYNLWAETYDRNLDDIFQIQDEIAASVAGVLGVTLGVGDVNSFRGAGTDSVEAYENFLLSGQEPRIDEKIRLLEKATELDSNYGAALAGLGMQLLRSSQELPPAETPEVREKALPYLLRARELNPNSVYAYQLLASATSAIFDWNQSQEYFEHALSISRDNIPLTGYGNLLMRAGRSEDAKQIYEDAYAAGRGVSSTHLEAYLSMENYTEAKEIASQLPDGARMQLNYLIALNERDEIAIEAAIGEFQGKHFVEEIAADLDMSLLQLLQSTDKALVALKTLDLNPDNVWPSKYHDIALVAAYFGDPEFSLDVFSLEIPMTGRRLGALWYPVMSNVRSVPEFKDLVTEINLVDYWRTYEWPDYCLPIGVDDFECF